MVSHRLGEEGNIKSSNWCLLGSLQTIQLMARTISPQASGTVKMTLDLKDLSVFEFAGNSSVSTWIDREALAVAFTDRSPGTQRTTMDAHTAAGKGVGTFAVRANIVPISKEEASFWISVIPLSTAELRAKLGQPSPTNPKCPPSPSTSREYNREPRWPRSPRQCWGYGDHLDGTSGLGHWHC